MDIIKYSILVSLVPTMILVDYRIAIASGIAYFTSQAIGINVFSYLKSKLPKYWYVRNNISTLISQSFDSFLFFFIAFYGIMDTGTLITLSLGALSLKYVCAILDTPLFYYFGVKK